MHDDGFQGCLKNIISLQRYAMHESGEINLETHERGFVLGFLLFVRYQIYRIKEGFLQKPVRTNTIWDYCDANN